MTPEQQRQIIDAINSTAVILAGYYQELVRLHVPEDLAKDLTVAMQNALMPSVNRPSAQP